MLALDPHPLAPGDLTGTRVADPVDGRQTVGTVAGETQTATTGRMQPGPEHRDEKALARLALDRPVVDVDAQGPTTLLDGRGPTASQESAAPAGRRRLYQLGSRPKRKTSAAPTSAMAISITPQMTKAAAKPQLT